MEHEKSKSYDIDSIRRNQVRQNKKFNIKVAKILSEAMKKIKLKDYTLKNSNINILDKIIRTCLKDGNLSGISKNQMNEKIIYKRKNKCIELNVNNKFIMLNI